MSTLYGFGNARYQTRYTLASQRYRHIFIGGI
jgi:hypothetical protein